MEIFIFGKGSEIVSCLTKRVKYQLLQGEPISDHLCLDNLQIFICCTGIGLLVQEQKMAEIVLADLVIHEIHWHWVVPAYLPLEVFIFGEGSGMASCLAKRVKYQLLQGETFLDLLYA